MPVLNPFILFNGNCETAFLFYQSVFGGEFSYVGRFKQMPPMEGQPALSASGRITMPMNKIFWGSYFGMFVE